MSKAKGENLVMQTKSIQLTNINDFIEKYRAGQMMDYFDYEPFDDYHRR